MSYSDDDDHDRYRSAEGWEPKPNTSSRRLQRQLAAADPGSSPFELVQGAKAASGRRRAPVQLFGPLWQTGELAVLFGPAAGKSVLAVQIADQIARGRSPFPNPKPRIPNQKVLYVDFERTHAQFTGRYSAPHPLPGKLDVRYRFSPNFIRAGLGPIDEIPRVFGGDPHRYFTHWLRETADETGARVLVIDNIAYLARTLTGRGGTGVMKTLKLWCAELNLSILAVTHAKPSKNSPPGLRRGGTASVTGWSALKPVTLTDLAGSPAIADLADSVFAIAPSRLAPDLRYIKHLKSRRAPLLSEEGWTPFFGERGGGSAPQTVLTCQIGRNHPREQEGSSASSALIPHSALRTSQSVSPFLGLTFLGPAPESIHLTDPFAPLLSEDGWMPASGRRGGASRRTEKRVTQSPRPALPKPRSQMTSIEMLLSREYWRYLER